MPHAFRRPHLCRLLLLAVVAACCSPDARGQAPAVEPARSAADVQKDMEAAGQAMSDALPSLDALYDPAKRAAVAARALPAMRRMARVLEEFARVEPRAAAQVDRSLFELRAWMAVLGDVPAEDEIRRLTLSNNDAEATSAKAWLLVVRWARAARDAAAQERLAGELSALAKARPDHPTIAQAAAVMTDMAATPALSEQAERVVAEDMRGGVAQQTAQVLAARRRLRSLVGKPLVVEGLAVDGTRFSSAAWKGKVVLVDHWATWCGECRAAMPDVKKAYADYRGQGLEVLGVSWDRDVEDLKGYLAENKDVAWPQLFEPGQAGQHPLAERYGVQALPTMFLIDRKGIVRSVTARENYKELIPKLLAEKE